MKKGRIEKEIISKRKKSIMLGVVPKIVVLVVYKTKSNTWRGFCSPFDIICEAYTKEEAMKRLERLVKLYKEGLKKYNYPKHLSIRRLSDEEDQKIFEEVKKEITLELKEKIEEFKRRYLEFQAEKEKPEEKIEIKNGVWSGYFCPQFNIFQCA